MYKLWLAILAGAILLIAYGRVMQQSAVSNSTATLQPTAPKPAWIEPTPLIPTDAADTRRSSVDKMPLLGGANLQTYTDEAGILRSPIDNMPLLPGDPNVAPMPDGMSRK